MVDLSHAGHKRFGPITTARLRLRPYTKVEADADQVYRLMSDPQVMRHYPSVCDREQASRVLDRMLDSYTRFGYSLLAVERLMDGEYIGQVGLLHWDDVDAREDVEVAYMLLPEYWGKGYATEAARASRDWAFNHLNVDRIVSFIAVQNNDSISVAMRNGMTRLKRLDENRFNRPIFVYQISRNEWEAMKV
jgi:RimJ/RimL family protein N-acetyltransferase